jgi:hypothetical protein
MDAQQFLRRRNRSITGSGQCQCQCQCQRGNNRHGRKSPRNLTLLPRSSPLSRTGTNGVKLSEIWNASSPRRGREDSSRGFNPGNPGPRRRALKGRQMKRGHNTGQTCTHLSPFQGEPFVSMVPRVETPGRSSPDPSGHRNHAQHLENQALDRAGRLSSPKCPNCSPGVEWR